MLAAPRAAAPVPQELAAELRRAAEIGDIPKLQALLGKQPVIDARDEDGRTALMLATLHGQTAAVDALLARGADPNAADARGMTPLQAAVAGNQRAIVAALQRAGAR
jgi:ankyrin repeat protein